MILNFGEIRPLLPFLVCEDVPSDRIQLFDIATLVLTDRLLAEDEVAL